MTQPDYHTTDPISLRPIQRDLTWAEEYAQLHGMSRSSVYNQALAAFRMQGDAAGWVAAELLALLQLVVEALGIPFAATAGDDEIRQPILDARLMVLLTSLQSVIDRGPDSAQIPWTIGYVREQLAKHPAEGYRTDYAQVIAERDGITVEQARAQITAAGQAARAAQAARQGGADVATAIAAGAGIEAGQ